MKLFIFIFVFLMMFPLCRCIVKNLHLVGIYGLIDVYNYIRYRKWQSLDKYFGIDMFVGMFGKGKTLSMTHRARTLYKMYGDRIRFISNYKLVDIPYIKLVSFNQIVDLQKKPDNYELTVVLIDEIEFILNNRNYSKFPLAMLSSLTQQRSLNVYILCSAQRFQQVDKMWRILTNRVFNCNKYWRFQHVEVYDAWDLENSMNYRDIKRLNNLWWFVKNQDYNAYDTKEVISQASADDFISNEESILRIGETNQNTGAVTHYSRSYKKSQNKKKR